MNLHVVRKEAQLCWPSELFPAPESHTQRGWENYLVRHPEIRERGLGGYVVDLDAPLEEDLFCKNQGLSLQPIEDLGKKRGRPKGADKIDFEAALEAIKAHLAEEEPESPREGREDSEAKEASSGASGDEGQGRPPQASTKAPDVEGRLFVPYEGEVAKNWRGRYETPEGEVTHLLRVGSDKPADLDSVSLVERPTPLTG